MEVDPPHPSRPPGRYDMWQASVEHTLKDLRDMRGVLEDEEIMGEAAHCIGRSMARQ